MATVIRPEISKRNKYWINKHRQYELKHFCLQYPIWKKTYDELTKHGISSSATFQEIQTSSIGDPTAKRAIIKVYYSDRINMIEEAAKKTDKCLYQYIIKAVTEGYSYTYLKMKYDIPCNKNTYYEMYRRFFWILSQERD